jgi:hypothetical protein
LHPSLSIIYLVMLGMGVMRNAAQSCGAIDPTVKVARPLDTIDTTVVECTNRSRTLTLATGWRSPSAARLMFTGDELRPSRLTVAMSAVFRALSWQCGGERDK